MINLYYPNTKKNKNKEPLLAPESCLVFKRRFCVRYYHCLSVAGLSACLYVYKEIIYKRPIVVSLGRSHHCYSQKLLQRWSNLLPKRLKSLIAKGEKTKERKKNASQ